MILRKLADAIREQNWFTVIIEFSLVVAGVLVALQFDNWNEDRQAGKEEERLVSQLQVELKAAIETKEAWVQSTQAWWDTLAASIEIVQSDDEDTQLSPKQCQRIWASHLIFFGISNLATLDEMLANGGLGTLSDKDLSNSLLAFAAARKQRAELLAFVRSDFANLVDVHTDALPRFFENTPQNGEFRDIARIPINTRVDCQLNKIRENQTMKNKLISNLVRTAGVINEAKAEIEQMRDLNTQLEGSLE